MRARVPRVNELHTLPPPGPGSPDLEYRGRPAGAGEGRAQLPREARPEDLALGQLATAVELLQQINAVLRRGEATGEAEPRVVRARASLTELAAPNRFRDGLTVFNDGSTTLRVLLGAGAAADRFSFKLEPGGLYEATRPVYQGTVTGVWDGTPTGNAMVTEFV